MLLDYALEQCFLTMLLDYGPDVWKDSKETAKGLFEVTAPRNIGHSGENGFKRALEPGSIVCIFAVPPRLILIVVVVRVKMWLAEYEQNRRVIQLVHDCAPARRFRDPLRLFRVKRRCANTITMPFGARSSVPGQGYDNPGRAVRSCATMHIHHAAIETGSSWRKLNHCEFATGTDHIAEAPPLQSKVPPNAGCVGLWS